MSIKRRLLRSHLVTSLAPLVVVGVGSYLVLADGLKARAVASLEALAESQSARIQGVAEQNAERLRLVSSRTQLRLSLRNWLAEGDAAELARVERILADARAALGDFHGIHVVDVEGRAVASVGAEGDIRLGSDLPRALEEVVVDRFRPGPDGRERWQLAGPLELDGAILGAVVVETGLEKIDAALEATPLLAASARGHVIADLPEPRVVSAGEGRPLTARPADLLAATERADELVTADGPRRLAVRREVPSARLHLVVTIERAEVFESIRLTALVFAAGLALAAAGIIAMALRETSAISAPLTRLARVAVRFGEGDFLSRAEHEVDDEVRSLTEAFNKMAVQVATMNAELEARVAERTDQVRQTNERLARVVALQDAVIRSADTAIVAADGEGRVTLFNPVAEQLFGFASDEVLGRFTLAHFDAAGDASRLSALLAAARPFDDHGPPEEWTCVRKDGTRFAARVTLSRLPDGSHLAILRA